MYNLTEDEVLLVDGGGDGGRGGASNQRSSGYPASKGTYNRPGYGPLSPNCVGSTLAGAIGGYMTGGPLGGLVGANMGSYSGGCFNGRGGY